MHWPTIFTTQEPRPAVLLVWLVFNIGAIYRLCRAIARDTMTSGLRHNVQTKYSGSLVTLITCMWCLGFWLSLIGAVLTYFDSTRPWWLFVAGTLSISTFVGLLGEVA